MPIVSGIDDQPLDEAKPVGAEAKIGDCALYEHGNRRPGRIALSDAAEAARASEGFVWIGLQQPTAAEIAEVAQSFDLPALAVEDAVKAHQRPKLEVYGDVLFVVLKPVRYVDHDEMVEVTELALFIGEGFVVSVRHGASEVLTRVRDELDAGSALLELGPTAVLYRAADLVVDGYEETIDLINDDVDEIEIQVFGTSEDGHAERIYKLKREIAQFRRAVFPLAVPMQRLAERNVPLVDADAAPFFRDVHDHLLRAIDSIESHDRLLSDVLQADLARLGVRQSEISVRQNEDMRKISAWAAIGLLPTAVAGIYGMNFGNMPELDWKYGYFLVIGLILSSCLALYRLFRRNGWL
ncbi:MAG: magnesium and cobalt transport protein CorA [Aquihabitans sp.]